MQYLKSHRLGLAAAAVVLAIVSSGTAVAVLTGEAGGQQIRVDKRTENVPSKTNSTVFKDVLGANVRISLNASRLIDASFTAESLCFGPAGTHCSVRIIALNLANNVVTELNPVAGLNFAFDSVPVSQDNREGHAIERSRRLPPGNYEIRVQAAVTNGGTTLELDDWHFAVYQNA